MARKSLATLNAATVVPATPKQAIAKEPSVKLSDASGLVAELKTRLSAAGVKSADLPTDATLNREVSDMIVSQIVDGLASLANALKSAKIGPESVTLKPKGETGRATVAISPETAAGVWAQGAVSITFDGAVGQAIRDLFPRA